MRAGEGILLSVTSPESILSVTEGLYAAALGDRDWADVLERTSALVGAEGSTVEVHERTAGQLPFFVWSGVCGEGAREFQEHYRFCNSRHDVIERAPPGVVVHDYVYTTEAEILRTEFYNDFLRPHGLKYYVAGVLERTADRVALASFQLSERGGPADDRQLTAARLVLPHIALATRTAMRLTAVERRATELEAALDSAGVAILLLDRSGRVLFGNARARAGLAGRWPLTVAAGRLDARNTADSEALRRVLSGTSRTNDLCGPRVARLGGAGTDEITVSAMSLPPEARDRACARAAHLLLTVSEAPRTYPRPAVLEAIFGLTPAEAHLAAQLCAGVALQDYADRRRVSIHTVRTHFARLKRKLGARTPAEVTARLTALAPPDRP